MFLIPHLQRTDVSLPYNDVQRIHKSSAQMTMQLRAKTFLASDEPHRTMTAVTHQNERNLHLLICHITLEPQ
ncbi:hypothetical protein T01_13590 [Trichinella spiralis]|uniref:Uncharacterized protein n=1 Tax=Trichinella spiralis TaxID=6334 RepID=A0A0V1B0K6_TRISP|nr:hypothetical protein T01_13590 [Trichinella spiralis]